MNVTWVVQGVRLYRDSRFEIGLGMPDPAPFTSDELRSGTATRVVELTPEETWRSSVCLRCDLPLAFHPARRKTRAKDRYCKAAKKVAMS
jgi:hypothetical protein